MALGETLRCWRETRLYDALMRAPIVIFTAAFILRDLKGLQETVTEHVRICHCVGPAFVAMVASRISILLFLGLLAVLHLARRRPVARAAGLSPRLAALLATLMPLSFLMLKVPPPSLAWDAASVVVVFAANVTSLIALSYLGRSVSIMPEARRLVREGPYAVIRHPLYLAELTGAVGVLLTLRSAAAALLVLAIFLLQLMRMRYEEGVLAQAFPDYAAYAAAVPRLWPASLTVLLRALLAVPGSRIRAGLAASATGGLAAAAIWVLPGPLHYYVTQAHMRGPQQLRVVGGPYPSARSCRAALAAERRRLRPETRPGTPMPGACATHLPGEERQALAGAGPVAHDYIHLPGLAILIEGGAASETCRQSAALIRRHKGLPATCIARRPAEATAEGS